MAGLSAAHHLLKRGQGRFEVEIFERRTIGGKARSGEKEDNGLPTEHGFRFFPGFYKHVTRTMKEIPLDTGGNVYDNNLVDTEVYTFLFSNKSGRLDVPINIGSYISKLQIGKLKKKLSDLQKQKEETGIKITEAGVNRFTESMLEVYTTCNARIESNYDNISWADYIDAGDKSGKYGEDYDALLATGISKNLVAVRADIANARTGAKLIGHMLWHIVSPFAPRADKILNAPTKFAWIDPWIKHLTSKGLKIHNERRAVSVEFDPETEMITGFRHDDVDAIYNVEDPDLKGKAWKYYDDPDLVATLPYETADYFICAMPIERIDEMLERSRFEGAQIKAFDPTLNNFRPLWENTEWMTGIMLYFDTEIPLAKGHITVADEEAAVTLISQFQFWTEYLKKNVGQTRGGKTVKAILSVIISNWDAESKYIPNKGVKLKNLTREEVVNELTELLFRCEIEKNKKLGVYRDNLIDVFLDDSIVEFDNDLANPRYKSIEQNFFLYNKEPLFINETHSYHLRPTVYTFFKNLFLASDYVKTNADLGCMDSADEAARRAVNSIFRREQLRNFCRIDLYKMPSLLGLLDTARILDYRNFKKGLYYRQNFIRRLLKWFTGKILYIVGSRMPWLLKGVLLVLLAIAFLCICLVNMVFMVILKLIYVTAV